MKLEFEGNSLVVTRELGDKRSTFYGIGGGRGESLLLAAIKKELNQRGFNLKKIRMHKDGHMVDDTQCCLTAKSDWVSHPHITIWNPHYSIAGCEESYNKNGKTFFRVEFNIFVRNDRNGDVDDKKIIACLMESYGKPYPKTIRIWNDTYIQAGMGAYPYNCILKKEHPNAMIWVAGRDTSQTWVSEHDLLFLTRDRSLDTYA
jgi:hypothetical protein